MTNATTDFPAPSLLSTLADSAQRFAILLVRAFIMLLVSAFALAFTTLAAHILWRVTTFVWSHT